MISESEKQGEPEMCFRIQGQGLGGNTQPSSKELAQSIFDHYNISAGFICAVSTFKDDHPEALRFTNPDQLENLLNQYCKQYKDNADYKYGVYINFLTGKAKIQEEELVTLSVYCRKRPKNVSIKTDLQNGIYKSTPRIYKVYNRLFEKDK